jgi:hypothetical protein
LFCFNTICTIVLNCYEAYFSVEKPEDLFLWLNDDWLKSVGDERRKLKLNLHLTTLH